MNDSPIGIFDSGLGGIFILKNLVKKLPFENIIYVADHRHIPYGKKTKKEIQDRSLTISNWLLKKKCKLIIVACNTATTNAIKHLRKKIGIPIIGVEPAIKPATKKSVSKKIGILATQGTLKSELFNNTKSVYANDIDVIMQIGFGLVNIVENGEAKKFSTEQILTNNLKILIDNDVDTIVLGCTHYSFLIPTIKKLVPKKIKILDSTKAVVKHTKNILLKESALSKNLLKGQVSFYSTGKIKMDIWNKFDINNVSKIKI
tara:strand:- start:169 stop:948 length:780 start_codon:yes stop_codon:yes gene_type:complete